MAKIRLIVEHYGTVQVAEDHWRDGTCYLTVEVDAPDWLEAGIRAVAKGDGMRVVGAEAVGAPEVGCALR